MSKKKIGTEEIQDNGGSLVVKAPREWLSHYGMEVGTPVFVVLTLDGVLRYHLQKQPWSRKGRVRLINGNGWLTVGKDAAKKLGIKKGTVVKVSVDPDNGVLFVERVKA